MTHRTCSVDGCGRRHEARGWCNRHYKRWRTHGDPEVTERSGVRPADPEVRFRRSWSEVPSGCWEWQRAITDVGYGLFSVSPRQVLAHRWSYEHHVGAIPDGYHLDHLCRVRHCVNPEHLEPVTPAENNRRSDSPSAANARKTHCVNGHEFTSENTTHLAVGQRQCRQCNRDKCRRQRQRKKENSR